MALSSQAAQEFVQLNCLAWIGGCDGLFEVEGIFQVFEELGDDLIRQLIYELFGAFLESTHDLIISVGAGAGQLPGPSYLTPSLYLTLALSAGGEGRGEVPSPFTERVRERSHLPTRSLMSHSLIMSSAEPEAKGYLLELKAGPLRGQSPQ
jgi:hypothetical protein